MNKVVGQLFDHTRFMRRGPTRQYHLLKIAALKQTTQNTGI